ncbi:stage II sporulation protein M [soil metagenome]
MDLDAYSAAHRDEWEELARLGSKSSFSGVEADALIDHYQSGASQLSAIKTTSGQSVTGDRLSLWLSRARLRFTGASTNVLSQLPHFFVNQLPAALYGVRWLSLVVTAASALIAVIYGAWAASDPQVLAATSGTEADLESYRKEFVDYYSNYSGSSFTGFVWTNNAWVAAQSIFLGVFGVFTPVILFTNAQSVGIAGARLEHFGELDVFFQYIGPHGQLELYSIFVAGATGMSVFWAWVAPGRRTRGRALAEEGRALFTIVIGLIGALLVSGIIEGFVTRQPWPWPIKIGIGTVALVAFLSYQWIVGGRAARAGETGDLEEFEAGAKQLVSG